MLLPPAATKSLAVKVMERREIKDSENALEIAMGSLCWCNYKTKVNI